MGSEHNRLARDLRLLTELGSVTRRSRWLLEVVGCSKYGSYRLRLGSRSHRHHMDIGEVRCDSDGGTRGRIHSDMLWKSVRPKTNSEQGVRLLDPISPMMYESACELTSPLVYSDIALPLQATTTNGMCVHSLLHFLSQSPQFSEASS